MHQHPRPPPVTASAASSPKTNPTRTNNPRDQEGPPSGSSSDMGGPSNNAQEEFKPPRPSSDGKDSVAKLNQVVQNFFTKAVLIILSQRTTLEPAYSKDTGEKRVNKWFNVEIDETNELALPLQPWRTSSIAEEGPPDMVLEVYVEVGTSNERGGLILQDEHGRQWGVEDAIRSYMDNKMAGEKSPHNPHVVLERWRLKLDPSPYELPSDLDKALPKTYKHSIMLFRSLFAYMKLLPAWELFKKRRNLKPSQRVPPVKYRIYLEGQNSRGGSAPYDELAIPFDESRVDVTESFTFESISSPAGTFSVEVDYRRRSDFRVERSMESVYSSRFIGQDEELFKPSLDRFNRKSSLGMGGDHRTTDVGSLPQAQRELAEIAEKGQAYGSLSTFHGVSGRLSSSPLSAMRAATAKNDKNAPSSVDEASAKALQDARADQGSRASVRSDAPPQSGRRTSVSFMPFKTPTLSSSPLQTDKLAKPPSRPSVGTSALSALAEARKPSITAQPASQPRPSPLHADTTPAMSLSNSPRPTVGSRYSSSFGHRRARLSVGGSKTEDDEKTSSGKASTSSSIQQPGSGMLTEAAAGSSGSLNTDDDNISDFLKLLDQKKDLKSFQTTNDGPSTEAATRRTNAALSKFQRLKDSNLALTDSMSSSLMLQRSSTSSSRQLSSVPPMVAGNSTSIASSPGERMSPRTPHTPAIPSRLSANSIVEYGNRTQRPRPTPEEDQEEEEATQRFPTPIETGAIDIPTSPRPFNSYRRSSSVAQRRGLMAEDDLNELPYGMRSASMGDNEERTQLTISELLQAGPGEAYVSLPEERTQSTARANSETRSGAYRGGRGRGDTGTSGRIERTPEGTDRESLDHGRTGSESGERRGGKWVYGSGQRSRAGTDSGSGQQAEEDDGMLFTMN